MAEQIGLPDLLADHVAIHGVGANPTAKVMTLLAGMVAGADSIEDTDRLRKAGNPGCSTRSARCQPRVRSLRAITYGHM